MRFNVGFTTDIGRKRQQNQDRGVALPDLGLFIVADGMGGHRGGEIASAMVVEIVPQIVRQAREKPGKFSAKDTISQAIRAANEAIYAQALKQPSLQGMGTTTTAILFEGEAVTVAQVGDSRCYYARPEEIWQVSRDHSLVQEKLKAGLITREQLKTDRMKNVITRSVGFEPQVNVETYEMSVQAGDVFMLCSDGLSGLVDDIQMLHILKQGLFKNGDIQKSADDLVRGANDNGGDDNVTVALVQVLATG